MTMTTTTRITAKQVKTAEKKAVDALLAFYADTDEHDHLEAEREAQQRVTDAIKVYGLTHRQLALLTGLPGTLVASLITDDELRTTALRDERFAAERYLDEVFTKLKTEVSLLSQRGASEYRIMELTGVTRVTIRKWRGKGKNKKVEVRA